MHTAHARGGWTDWPDVTRARARLRLTSGDAPLYRRPNGEEAARMPNGEESPGSPASFGVRNQS